MFGYVRPCKPEMKIREFETYQAVYCGLCKQLGRGYGLLSRLTLNYDFTFLALLSLAVKDTHPCYRRERCIAHPLRKRHCCLENEGLEFAAGAAALMLYYKAWDNRADSPPLKRLLWRLVMPYFSRLRKKALPRFAAVDQIFREMTESQQRLEKSGCSSTDQAAEPTAKALSALLAMLQDDPLERRVLEQMGYQLGRWIYFMDALDDIHEDFINKGYNPFIQKNPELFEGITEEQWKKEGIPETILDSAIGSLNLTAAQLAAAYGLLTVRQLKPVLDNIIYLGLEESRKAVLLRHRPAEKRPKAENFTNSDG